uniref:E3 ubiquitin-protein ligase RNF123-like n=1 Tax=Myxine glutinosa TaxID=7769 RepID=UPI00358E8EAE
MGYLKSAMTMTVDPHEVSSVPVRGDVNVFLAISHIFAHLTPLLAHSYLVDAVLLKFLLTANAEPESSVFIPYFLDLAWVLMEDFEVENSLKQLMMSLLRAFRFSPLSPDMGEQVCHLQLLLVILQHDKSRRFLLNSVLYPHCCCQCPDLPTSSGFNHMRPSLTIQKKYGTNKLQSQLDSEEDAFF